MWNEYIKDLTLPKGWADVSYRNDALPSFMSSDNYDKGYHIWIDSHDIKERKQNSLDIYGLENKLAPRFHVVLGYGGEENLFTSDNFNEVVKWIENNPKTKEQIEATQQLY